jgi:preprotein translocase subunit YajC
MEQTIGNTATELSKNGIYGVFIALVVIIGILIYVLWRIIQDNNKRNQEMVGQITEHMQKNTEVIAGFQEVIRTFNHKQK